MSQATLFLDLEGTVLTHDERDLLQDPYIGGVILFARNTVNAIQVAELVKTIREIRPEIIISLDQEGGRVQRLKEGVTLLPPVQVLSSRYAQDPQAGLCEAELLGYLMAAELRVLDIDLSFAPVLDVDYGRNTVIGNRAFANNIQAVTDLALAYIRGMKQAGMSATAKHFPGHGWADADTHHADAVDSRSFVQIYDSDLVPFREAIHQGIEAMMLAHVLYPECDQFPAGFSRYWLGGILRDKLAFKGVIFSDDLSMKAAESAGSYAERAAAAVAAGCQALLCCNAREGTLDILRYLREHNITPLQSICSLKGADFNLDPSRLDKARGLVKELMDVVS